MVKVNTMKTSSTVTSPERSRTKARVSQSQPGSRSTSPSSRYNYYTSVQPDGRMQRVRRKSGIPMSTSRDTSPTRIGTGIASMERRLSSGSSGHRARYERTSSSDRQQLQQHQQPPTLMAERILQQSQEAEVALENALRTTNVNSSPRKKFNAFDVFDHSDESETSR